MSTDVTGAATGGTAQGDTNAGAGTGGQAQPSFIDGLPEDIRGHEVLKGFDSAEKLARAHLDVLGKVPVVPEKADAYEIKVPEGHPVNQEFVGKFKAWAHEAGLSQAQAEKIAQGYIGLEQQMMAQAQTEATQAEAAIKTEWGDQYGANLAVAQKAVAEFCDPKDVEYLEKTGLGNNPALVRMFHRIGKAMSEDKIPGGGGGGGGGDMKRTAGGLPQLEFPSMEKKQ